MLYKSPVDARTMMCSIMQLYNQNKFDLFMEKGNSTKVASDQETNTAATML